MIELRGSAEDSGFADVTPAVLQIINLEFGEDEEPEEDHRPTAVVEAEKARQPKRPAPPPAVDPPREPVPAPPAPDQKMVKVRFL